MRFKQFIFPLLAAITFLHANPANCQTAPPIRRQSGWPIRVGVGPSSYDVDWGHGRMYGGTLWIDCFPGKLPVFMRGLGLELVARDISLNRSSTQVNVREDTAAAGLIYAWQHWQNLHPYVKALYGQGSMDFTPHGVSYSHDTRSLWAAGGGFDYRFHGPFWARLDYEHQTWQRLFGYYIPKPQGFTLGVAYDFSYPRAAKQ